MYLLLLQVEQLTKEIPKGERELLYWIIGILLSILVIVVTYFIRKTSNNDKQILDLSKESIIHISKTNEVITTLSGVVKESGHSSNVLNDSIKDLQNTIKSHNDYLPKLIKAVTGKEI